MQTTDKELKQQKANNLTEQWTTVTNRQITEEKPQIANKNMKTY